MVEVMVISSDGVLREELLSYTDTLIEELDMKNLSLMVKHPEKLEEMNHFVKEDKTYLVVTDIRDAGCESLNKYKRKNVFFLVIDEILQTAVDIINADIAVVGYVLYRSRMDYKEYKRIFIDLYKRLSFSVNGIMVYDYVSDDYILVPFSEILYIETVKGTHLCEIVSKSQNIQIRSTIRYLTQNLPWYFCQVRTSTIVNLKEVISTNFSERIITLSDNSFCTFTIKMKKQIKKLFQFEGI